jgi:hypothetical protein
MLEDEEGFCFAKRRYAAQILDRPEERLERFTELVAMPLGRHRIPREM